MTITPSAPRGAETAPAPASSAPSGSSPTANAPRGAETAPAPASTAPSGSSPTAKQTTPPPESQPGTEPPPESQPEPEPESESEPNPKPERKPNALSRFSTTRRLDIIGYHNEEKRRYLTRQKVGSGPAPVDLNDAHAFYIVTPDKRLEPAGIGLLDYCLITPLARSSPPASWPGSG
ncbi:MAG: hypothetical protein OXG35_17685 [Acidobacteria bacterium]|nr:hypothetical protein [Acidobacteriota bacterium]